MPRKMRRIAKKPYRKRYKKKRSNLSATNYAMTYIPKMSFNSIPLPPRYRTKVIAAGYAYTSSAAGSGTYDFTFDLNTPNTVFNFLNSGLTWLGLTTANYEPAGFTQLCNVNLYQGYHVYANSLELEIMPQSVTDSCVCVIMPSHSSTSPTSVASSLAQPFAKSYTVTTGRLARMKHYVDIPKFLGITRQAYLNDQSGAFYGAYNAGPTADMFWKIFINTGDNAILSNPLEIRVKMTMYIEFCNLTNGTLTE